VRSRELLTDWTPPVLLRTLRKLKRTVAKPGAGAENA
jgi:hypothetical protein